jgi:drug/metabolite transporter (DMT)-like permease
MTMRVSHSLSPATLAGLAAIGLWSSLAIFTAMTGGVPPFQLVAMTFTLGALFIAGFAALSGRLKAIKPTRASFLFGMAGLFGDTVLYFAALKLAPPAGTNIVHYLWPLLIVLMTGLLPGGTLLRQHLVGALLGFGATILLIGGDFSSMNDAKHWLGYLCAFFGAIIWAGYSVFSRRFVAVPTESLAVTLFGAAILGLLCHLAFETTRMPANATEWIGIVGLGLGPTGLAFLVWDIGMKRGDVAFLGVASYAAPVLSTLILVLAGFASPSLTLALACLMMIAAGLIASR